MRRSIVLLSATSVALATVAATAPAAVARGGARPALAVLPHVAYLTAAPNGPSDPGAPVTVPGMPSDAGGGVALLEREPELSDATDAEIVDWDAELQTLLAKEDDVQNDENQTAAEAAALQGKADPFNQKIQDLNAQIDAHNAKVSDLQARIDAHNAKPNQFTLPQQQAAANAYQAEVDELTNEKNALNAEGASIQSQIDAINSERSGLLNQLNKLETDINALETKIAEVQKKQQDLDSKRQKITEDMATDEESAIAQREAEAANAGEESAGAGDMAEGGDAPQPTDQSDPSTETSGQPSTSVQSNPAVDDSAGGDMPSQSSQNQALDTYGQQNGVTVIEQPVTVELPPQALKTMSPSDAAQISPSETYDGVVREPSGNYKAIEVVTPGSGYGPGQTAFDTAINSGTRATTTVNGRPAVIDSTDTVADPGPGPAPAPSPAPSRPSAPAPSSSPDNKPKDCRDTGPDAAGLGKVEPLSNEGWVVYAPFGPNGRATGMESCLFGGDTVGKTDPQGVTPAGWDNALKRAGQLLKLQPGDKSPLAACHFLAARFGGSNVEKRNFTACWQNPVNVSKEGMSGLENAVANDLRAGMVVEFDETAIYETDQSDTPIGYETWAVAQKPGTSRLIPIGSESIPNTKPINGVEENIGN